MMVTRSIPGSANGAADSSERYRRQPDPGIGESFSRAAASRRLMRIVALAGAAYSAYMAFRALQALMSERPEKQRLDVALDDALSDTFPASDPVTSY